MSEVADAVREFHLAFGQPVRNIPANPPWREAELRQSLIEEEVCELTVAAADNDVVGVADALGDIVYVAYGTALAYGIDLDAVIAEIHRSNMTKLGSDGQPVYRADGKVLKGPDYRPPDIAGVMNCRRIHDPGVHQPFPDDGVEYCGWAGDGGIYGGCGALWPCRNAS